MATVSFSKEIISNILNSIKSNLTVLFVIIRITLYNDFDISNLLKEEYIAGFGISQNDSVGNNVYLDYINRAFSFEIVKDNCELKNKKSAYWGNVKFNNISVNNKE